MNELDRTSVVAEAITRLIERAYHDASRDIGESTAVDNLVTASGWNPALLTAASEKANRLAEESSDRQLETAIGNLRSARKRVRQRAI